jgi:hypothetical protein
MLIQIKPISEILQIYNDGFILGHIADKHFISCLQN